MSLLYSSFAQSIPNYDPLGLEGQRQNEKRTNQTLSKKGSKSLSRLPKSQGSQQVSQSTDDISSAMSLPETWTEKTLSGSSYSSTGSSSKQGFQEASEANSTSPATLNASEPTSATPSTQEVPSTNLDFSAKPLVKNNSSFSLFKHFSNKKATSRHKKSSSALSTTSTDTFSSETTSASRMPSESAQQSSADASSTAFNSAEDMSDPPVVSDDKSESPPSTNGTQPQKDDSQDNRDINESNDGDDNDNTPSRFLESLSGAQPATGYPFLRALHSFDSTSLSAEVVDPEEDPASICLSFQESEIVLLHSIHPSGWGDATILSTGVRGWIPTNYFTPYTEPKVTHLLTAVLGFVLNPKSQPLTKTTDSEVQFSFSQSSITSIVAGVRSLLEACGTLTRDTQIIRRSQAIRKFRKILLAELAILVSLAKQYRNTADDANIERLVNGSYKVISRAVVFLDIWTIDTSNETAEEPGTPTSLSNTVSIDNLQLISKKSKTQLQPIEPIVESQPEELKKPDEPVKKGKAANRESVIFHNQPPNVRQRLDEVNDALTSYLGNFIHRLTVLETDPTACTQILVNTRKSMLACRELLAAVESISSRSLPRNKELEMCKDKLFGQIRSLVTAARDVVASTPAAGDMLKNMEDEGQKLPVIKEKQGQYSAEGQRLIDIATDCARTSGECVVRCRQIIEKIGDFQLSPSREYPDFSDGIIASNNNRKRSSIIVPKSSSNHGSLSTLSPYTSETESTTSPTSPHVPFGRSASIVQTMEGEEEKHASVLPQIQLLSPLISEGESEPMGSIEEVVAEKKDAGMAPEDQIIVDDNGRVRGGSLDALVKVLTDENNDADPMFMATFFLTFRQFSNALELAESLVRRFACSVDETTLSAEQVEGLFTRRTKVYQMFKRWMEGYWKQSQDVVVVPQIVNFANSHLVSIPNAKTVLNDLAAKVQQLQEGEAIVPRTVPVQTTSRVSPQAYAHMPLVGTQVSKGLAMTLARAVAQSETQPIETVIEEDSKSAQSGATASTWSSSLRKANPLSSSLGGGQVSILDVEPADIAKQLCLMDSQVFCRIKADELLDLNFSLKRRHLGLAPNVVEMTQMSNQLSTFVGDSILCAESVAKTRKNLLKHWIKVCEKLYELRNYNSLMTIISALQSVNIMRLKKTWELLAPRYSILFQELRAAVSMDKNYASYRAALKASEIPTLPFLGLYLTDLTFVLEGNSMHRVLIVGEDGKVVPPGRGSTRSRAGSLAGGNGNPMVINFDRYERTAAVIGELQSFQVPYRAWAVPELQAWLKQAMQKSYKHVAKDHNNLWRRSCIVEPK